MDKKETNNGGGIAIGRSLPISTKQSVEICNLLRGKTSEQGRKLLGFVLEKKFPVPYRRYMHGVGHRSGKLAAGRYPFNASSCILSILKSAEANAENKGMTAPFKIEEVIANQASRSWHHGRQRRRKTKSTHLKIVLTEIKMSNEKNRKNKTEEVKSKKVK